MVMFKTVLEDKHERFGCSPRSKDIVFYTSEAS